MYNESSGWRSARIACDSIWYVICFSHNRTIAQKRGATKATGSPEDGFEQTQIHIEITKIEHIWECWWSSQQPRSNSRGFVNPHDKPECRRKEKRCILLSGDKHRSWRRACLQRNVFAKIKPKLVEISGNIHIEKAIISCLIIFSLII